MKYKEIKKEQFSPSVHDVKNKGLTSKRQITCPRPINVKQTREQQNFESNLNQSKAGLTSKMEIDAKELMEFALGISREIVGETIKVVTPIFVNMLKESMGSPPMLDNKKLETKVQELQEENRESTPNVRYR